jgi:ribosomal protein S20
MSRFQVAGFAALLVIAALAGGTVIGSVAAATPPSSATSGGTTAAAASPATRVAGESCATFRRAFAANLGVDEAALVPAAKAASIATIDAAVDDGRMTKATADRLKARIENAAADGCALLAGRLARAGAALGVAKDGVTAAADTLGMTPAELRAKLRAGTLLKDIAEAKGVRYETVTAAVLAAVKADLDAAVVAGTIRQARADRVLERLARNLAAGRLRNERAAAPSRPSGSPVPTGPAGSPVPTTGS